MQCCEAQTCKAEKTAFADANSVFSPAAPSRNDVINLAGFDDESITNGPGLRAVIFTQGCPHHCPGCHNPQTHAFGVGRDYMVRELFERIRRNPLVGGVTFSGGEPFSQPEPLAELGKLLKEAGYELAIYSGYTFEELLAMPDPAIRRLLEQADVLVDGEYRERERNILLRFRGSANQRILNLPSSLQARKAIQMPPGRWRENA
ncbi:MAG: anaerobic ribonucleoside-triphosphate reductase activating protein [Lentisphaeria bacterium]|nr:anaerobic ribonucleoside-triphosphate reductase activating protein [Lentisphaeria bacterium]